MVTQNTGQIGVSLVVLLKKLTVNKGFVLLLQYFNSGMQRMIMEQLLISLSVVFLESDLIVSVNVLRNRTLLGQKSVYLELRQPQLLVLHRQ